MASVDKFAAVAEIATSKASHYGCRALACVRGDFYVYKIDKYNVYPPLEYMLPTAQLFSAI